MWYGNYSVAPLSVMMSFLKYMVGGRRCFTAYQRGKAKLDHSKGADENAEGARIPRKYVVETTSPGT